MTTIATDGKSMAGDGQVNSRGTVITTNAIKIHRLKDGGLVGCCGFGHDGDRFRGWLDHGGKAPRVDRNFGAIVLMPDGGVLWYSNEMEPERISAPAAIGSGMDFAIGAMEAGANAHDAILIASRRDPNTGGKITVEHLEHALREVA